MIFKMVWCNPLTVVGNEKRWIHPSCPLQSEVPRRTVRLLVLQRLNYHDLRCILLWFNLAARGLLHRLLECPICNQTRLNPNSLTKLAETPCIRLSLCHQNHKSQSSDHPKTIISKEKSITSELAGFLGGHATPKVIHQEEMFLVAMLAITHSASRNISRIVCSGGLLRP